MAEDKTGWSEKGKGAGRERPAEGAADAASGSTTPSRPSKRDTSSSGAKKQDSSVVRTPSADAGARKVAKAAATAGQRDVSFLTRLGFPALVGLICLVGIVVVYFAWEGREALASPQQNVDHWHAVYGVYNCNSTGEGDDKYLPPFLSGQDDTGIHSHGDGLLHIHPFFELSSGDNAQMRHFFTEMNVDITPERITIQNAFDPPTELIAGAECLDGTGPAEIKVLHWNFDFEATGGGDISQRVDPDIITEDFDLIKFDHDREVFVFAYMGANTDIADIPNPPEERFNTLNNVSSALEYSPTQLVPQDTGTEVTVGGDADADAESGGDAETEADE